MRAGDGPAEGRGRPRQAAELSGSPVGAQAEVHLSVPSLVEVMKGEAVALNCTPLGAHDHFVLEWFLVSAGPGGQGTTGLRTCIPSSEPKGPKVCPDPSSPLPFLLDPTEHVNFWVDSPSTTEGWVREGDSVQLFCRGDGSPNPEYTFFRLQDKQEDVLKTNLEGNLTLEGVQRGQSGTYGCRVEDYDAAEDAELSKTLELRVAYLDPLELSTREELSLPLGNSTAVNCSVQGLPTPALRWTKDSIPLGNGPTLSLSSITFDSAGTYICEASMPTVPLLSRSQSFKLLVQGPPELRAEETQPRSEGSWREGDEVRLVCSARGYPEPKLSWSQLGGSVRDLPPHPEPCGTQRGVAVMAVAVSVGLLLLVVAAFYCMRRKGRPGCCRQGEKGAPPPGEPELSHSGSERPEQTGLLTGGASGGARHGSGGFRDE
uniref:Ig-like domain-containing protein n=1 Tax=Panthera tigris altaica TaxID=74533 RepID=A0A8C9K9U4_PANTA